jgi:hypothetical protein
VNKRSLFAAYMPFNVFDLLMIILNIKHACTDGKEDQE